MYGDVPPVAVKLTAPVELPLQRTFVWDVLDVGFALTVTTIAALETLVQKLASVCVTEYEPDVINVAVLPDAPLLHTYPVPVLDFKVTEPPLQKVVKLLGASDDTEIVGVAGKALTVIVPVADTVPEPPVKRMLY